MSDFAQSVKQQADIVKVIESYIRLRKAGAQRFSGLCPFHKEKSPSFNVNGGSQQFFIALAAKRRATCSASWGRSRTWAFPKRCGLWRRSVAFRCPSGSSRRRKRLRSAAADQAAGACRKRQRRGLKSNCGAQAEALAREYLTGRGLTAEGIKTFRIGYAPDGFHALHERLGAMADEETLRASGLFSSKEQGDGGQGPIYDRFRKRVMFPISNEGGRVIAFTARTLETGEKAGAKYLNSSETPLYTKGHVLFNLDKAKPAIRALEFALLVEGQMDCISVFLAGIQNVIATSGTAFTEQQVAILRRHTSNVIVNFDPDTAGANAAEKSIALLTEEGFTVKIVTLEGGLDPDRFIRERGVEAYKEALRESRRQSDYLIERARMQFPGASAEQKLKQMNFLLPHIRRMPETLAREQFAADAAQKLGIGSSVLREELRQAALKRRERVEERTAKLTEVERVLLRALAVTDPDGAEARLVAAEAVTNSATWFEHLGSFGAMQALAGRGAKDPMEAVEDAGQRALLAEALLGESRPPEANEVESAVQEVQERAIEGRLRDMRAQIAEAEKNGDLTGLALLTQQKLDLDRALRKIHRNSEKSV